MYSLKELKDEQQVLRERLISYYTHSHHSILSLSKDIKVPYSTLWGFMHSGSIGYKNTIKIKEWLDSRAPVNQHHQ